MDIIPVIDLMQGQVVHAVRGERSAYRPIVSRLCEGSDPLLLSRALLAACGTHRLYAADLDGILGRGAQLPLIKHLLEALPTLELWLDAGFPEPAVAAALLQPLGAAGARVVPVFGSESLRSALALQQIGPGGVLSLDRRGGERLDPAGCWDQPALWPERIIVMTLDRVGADSGPDLQTLADVRQRAPHAWLVGAGGIRDAQDLQRAETAGAQAWLVASALHNGRLLRSAG